MLKQVQHDMVRSKTQQSREFEHMPAGERAWYNGSARLPREDGTNARGVESKK